MFELSSDARKEELKKATPAQKEARERMALFPIAKGGHGSDGEGGARSELIFVAEDKWVPVLRLGGKVRPDFEVVGIELMRTAMRVPRYPKLVSAAPSWLDTLFAFTSRFIQAVPSFDLYQVSLVSFATPTRTLMFPVRQNRSSLHT